MSKPIIPMSLQPLLTKLLSRSLSHAIELSNTALLLVQPSILDQFSRLRHPITSTLCLPEEGTIGHSDSVVTFGYSIEKEPTMDVSQSSEPTTTNREQPDGDSDGGVLARGWESVKEAAEIATGYIAEKTADAKDFVAEKVADATEFIDEKIHPGDDNNPVATSTSTSAPSATPPTAPSTAPKPHPPTTPSPPKPRPPAAT
jgi:hypothetical protein